MLDVGQGQCISVISGDKTVLIDCGGIYSLDNAGETAGSYLLSRGRKRVDVLLLTHLHADHVNGVPRLLELVDVGEIIIPDAVTDEDGMLDEIVSAAESHGTALRRLDSDELFSVGNIELNLFAPSEKGDLNERCMMMRVSVGAFDMIVTGDAPQAAERGAYRKPRASGCRAPDRRTPWLEVFKQRRVAVSRRSRNRGDKRRL